MASVSKALSPDFVAIHWLLSGAKSRYSSENSRKGRCFCFSFITQGWPAGRQHTLFEQVPQRYGRESCAVPRRLVRLDCILALVPRDLLRVYALCHSQTCIKRQEACAPQGKSLTSKSLVHEPATLQEHSARELPDALVGGEWASALPFFCLARACTNRCHPSRAHMRRGGLDY